MIEAAFSQQAVEYTVALCIPLISLKVLPQNIEIWLGRSGLLGWGLTAGDWLKNYLKNMIG